MKEGAVLPCAAEKRQASLHLPDAEAHVEACSLLGYHLHRIFAEFLAEEGKR